MPPTRDPGRSRESEPPASSMDPLSVHTNVSDLCSVRVVGMNLPNRMVIAWNGGKARINRLIRIAPPRTRTVHDSIRCFPPKLIELVITHLIGNLHTFKALSLTCCSWYIAVVRAHHATGINNPTSCERSWIELCDS